MTLCTLHTQIWFFKGSLHAVMVLFRTISFWRTILCRNGSLFPSFVFQICNCQSTSLLIFWSSDESFSFLNLNKKINVLIFVFVFLFTYSLVCAAKLWKLLSSSPLSKRDNVFLIHIVRLFKLLLGFMYNHTQSQKKTIPLLFITFFF